LTERFLSSAVLQWVGKIGNFTLLQIAIQAINAVTGILIVRHLPADQYAWLTIVTSMNAAFIVLTEPVTNTGAQAIGGSIWKDRDALSTLVATTLHVRWAWLGWFAIGLLPWTLFLLSKSGASMPSAVLLCSAGFLAVPAVTAIFVHNLLPKLFCDLPPLQWSELGGAAFRLIFCGLGLLIGKIAWLILTATAAAHWCQLHLISLWTKARTVPNAPVSEIQADQLSKSMKSMAIYSIFLCFQAQAGVWLLGVFGSVNHIAELGALARLAILLAPLGSIAQLLFIPAIAKCTSMERLKYMSLLFLSGAGSLGVTVYLMCFLVPQPFLWILGPSYYHLTAELPLAMALASLNVITTILWSYNTARSWNWLSKWVPPATLAVLATAAWIMRPTTLSSVILFQMVGLLPSLLIGLHQSSKGWEAYKRMSISAQADNKRLAL